MRAAGGFGLVMTCASHVQEVGKGFPGQLGIFSDRLIEGHLKITANIKELSSIGIRIKFTVALNIKDTFLLRSRMQLSRG